jgi:hypothetical protein
MRASEYRQIVAIIARRAIKSGFPGLKHPKEIEKVSMDIARNIHARMYGANVDGVGSPLWRNENDKQPDVDATEILKTENV